MLTPPEVFKNLADETRARATLLIAHQGELCVCELMCALDDSQPKISRHLAQLRSSGLLLDRRQGQWVYYRLNPNLPAWVHEILQVTLQGNADWLQNNASRLQAMDGRPVRDAACCCPPDRVSFQCWSPLLFLSSPSYWSSGNPRGSASAGVPLPVR
jgi:ArsR family transcriptional regulator